MDGGVETAASYMQNFILALVCYPACQAKAQAEIDDVVGGDRVPTPEDFNDLPYLRALIKEVEFVARNFVVCSKFARFIASDQSFQELCPMSLLETSM